MRTSYALRTLCAPWLLLAALPLEVANFLQRGMPWRGEGMWTVEWFAIVLFVLGPLAAGCAAIDAARLSRPGNVHLVVTVPRGWRSYVRAAAWCAVPLAVVHLVTIGCALAYGDVTRPSVGWPALVVQAALQCLALTWYVALGSTVGRFVNPLVAGLAGSVLGFVLTYLLGDGGGDGHFALLGLGSATISRLGLAYRPSYVLSQALLLALTAAVMVLVRTRGVRGLRVPDRRGAVALGAAVTAMVLGQLLLPAQRLEAAPRAPELCRVVEIRVCFFGEHRRYADRAVGQIRTLVRAARAKGYDSLVPTAVVESSRTFAPTDPRTVTFSLPLSTQLAGQERIDDWAYELTAATHCPTLRAGLPPSERYVQRQAMLQVTWLHLVGVRSDLFDYFDGLRVLTPTEAARTVADFRACRIG